MQGERLQKVLAGWGLGSRRAIEQWIEAGEVKVNGEVATLGARILPTDRVEIRGQPVRSRAFCRPIVWKFEVSPCAHGSKRLPVGC